MHYQYLNPKNDLLLGFSLGRIGLIVTSTDLSLSFVGSNFVSRSCCSLFLFWVLVSSGCCRCRSLIVSKTEERVLKMFYIFLFTPTYNVFRRYITPVSILAKSAEMFKLLDFSFSYISSRRSLMLHNKLFTPCR